MQFQVLFKTLISPQNFFLFLLSKKTVSLHKVIVTARKQRCLVQAGIPLSHTIDMAVVKSTGFGTREKA